ncbi:MAG: hypothetical protein WCF79_03915 [Rhodomicrobium sp.]
MGSIKLRSEHNRILVACNSVKVATFNVNGVNGWLSAANVVAEVRRLSPT